MIVCFIQLWGCNYTDSYRFLSLRAHRFLRRFYPVNPYDMWLTATLVETVNRKKTIIIRNMLHTNKIGILRVDVITKQNKANAWRNIVPSSTGLLIFNVYNYNARTVILKCEVTLIVCSTLLPCCQYRLCANKWPLCHNCSFVRDCFR